MFTLTGKAHGANARRATSDSSIGICLKIELLPTAVSSFHSFLTHLHSHMMVTKYDHIPTLFSRQFLFAH